MHVFIYTTYFIVGKFVLYDVLYSELSWEQLVGLYPNIAYLISLYIRMMAILVIILQVFLVYAIYLVFWKGSKSAWVLATIGSGGLVIMELFLTFPVLITGTPTPIGGATGLIPYMAYMLFAIMIAISMILAGKHVFSKKEV
jgi:hypothetical protein